MCRLSANSQNMQGEGIDSLCLEEPFRNAPSGISLVRPLLHPGESRGQMLKNLGDGIGISGFLTVFQVGGKISHNCQGNPKIQVEFSVLLDN